MYNKPSSLVISLLIAFVLITFSSISSCKTSPSIDQVKTRDTVTVTYSNSISEILATNCIKCHKTGNTSGYVNLDSYENAKPFGLNGNLYGCVQHLDGNVGMPIGAPKLDSMNLLLIKRWCKLQCPL
ncbi:MAG: hypothetical protein ACO3A5_07965 [Bacteroidia bacterium]|jgi:hypothetical protein